MSNEPSTSRSRALGGEGIKRAQDLIAGTLRIKETEETGRARSAISIRSAAVGSLVESYHLSMDTAVRPAGSRAGSMRSLQSAWSATRETILITMAKRSSLVEGAKLAALSFLPLTLVFGLCIKSLLNADQDIKAANSIRASVERSQNVGVLVSSLLRERGLRCQSLAVEDEYTDAIILNDLVKAENATNYNLRQLHSALPPAFSNFTHELEQFRANSLDGKQNFSCANVTSWYTFYTKKLEEECSRPFSAGAVNSFWSAYFAYNALINAQDMIGLQRALGSNYYGDGSLSPRNYVYFAQNVGGADAILQQVTSVLYPPAVSFYSNLTESESGLMAEIEETVGIILDRASHRDDSILLKSADRYFNAVTDYMSIIAAVEDFIRDNMLSDVGSERKARMTEFQIILVLVVFVSISSPALTTWYAYRARKLMTKISHFTDRMKEQKSHLGLEKKRAELLLCQMLPKSIVIDMAQSRPIEPESFDEATIFFSRVDEFPAFAMRSEPFQVVGLLNHLYSKCDDILDQYDAYKVETIGDSYLIVSGVPKRNGRTHSAEIATIALHFLMMMESFQVPSLPDERVKLTLGIHTGQVVAGIMGVKQQRYCLFGDTVNVASRMMSSGIASRVHLSPEANDHLQKYHRGEFTTKLRGPITIKGKGVVVTHWLVGRRGFPFTVQMDNGAEQLRAIVSAATSREEIYH